MDRTNCCSAALTGPLYVGLSSAKAMLADATQSSVAHASNRLNMQNLPAKALWRFKRPKCFSRESARELAPNPNPLRAPSEVLHQAAVDRIRTSVDVVAGARREKERELGNLARFGGALHRNGLDLFFAFFRIFQR